MKVTVEFEEGDFNSMHDSLYDLTGHSYTHDELEVLWRNAPEDLRDKSIYYGMSDTEVRESFYKYFEERINKIKPKKSK